MTGSAAALGTAAMALQFVLMAVGALLALFLIVKVLESLDFGG
jgi:hypothetical protein